MRDLQRNRWAGAKHDERLLGLRHRSVWPLKIVLYSVARQSEVSQNEHAAVNLSVVLESHPVGFSTPQTLGTVCL